MNNQARPNLVRGAVGSIAPDFLLRAVDGAEYSLGRLLAGRRGAALLFMRGTW